MDTPVASESAKACLRLSLCEGVGPIRFSRILKSLGSVDAALAASAASLASVQGVGKETAERIVTSRVTIDVDAEVELASQRGVRIVCTLDPDYPPALRTISDPPPCLYIRGKFEAADALALGIVGARHCTRYGAEQAERFGTLAAQAGLTVVSGMARGIDTHAHRGALTGGGRTIAVLGCGLCHLYPPDAVELAEGILASGALVSELPMQTPPDEKNFPRRNRIIAGLSLGVLVVEAAARSGALITARLATDYNREVFALPGRVDSPHADGCHALIRAGEAKLVTNLGDILSELGEAGQTLMTPPSEAQAAEGTLFDPPPLPDNLDAEQRRLIEAFDAEPMSIDDLAEATSLSPGRVAAMLTTLQLRGLVRRVGGDFFERAMPRK